MKISKKIKNEMMALAKEEANFQAKLREFDGIRGQALKTFRKKLEKFIAKNAAVYHFINEIDMDRFDDYEDKENDKFLGYFLHVSVHLREITADNACYNADSVGPKQVYTQFHVDMTWGDHAASGTMDMTFKLCEDKDPILQEKIRISKELRKEQKRMNGVLKRIDKASRRLGSIIVGL